MSTLQVLENMDPAEHIYSFGEEHRSMLFVRIMLGNWAFLVLRVRMETIEVLWFDEIGTVC
jgi:hypothetical protein